MTRIALWSPNYAPEPMGIPPLVTEAAEWLAGRGHQVDVVTAVPNYPERRIYDDFRGVWWRTREEGGVRVHRSWLRVRPAESIIDKALYELTISTFALPNALRFAPRAEVVVCVVPTLLAATYAAALAHATRKRLVLWVQDLVLSAAAALDDFGDRAARLFNGARSVERYIAQAADLVVVCSPGFRDYFVDLGVAPTHIETVLNWATVESFDPSPRTQNGGKPLFLYAGNIGYTQGFDTLIEAARLARDELRLDIVGAGNAVEAVAAATNSVDNVRLLPPIPHSRIPELYASVDAQVVIQRKLIAGANLPSKIAPYLASGRPVVASIDLGTPAAELLRRSGGAVLVEPESPAALAEGMRQLARDAQLRADLGLRGREFAERVLAKDPALERLEAAFLG